MADENQEVQTQQQEQQQQAPATTIDKNAPPAKPDQQQATKDGKDADVIQYEETGDPKLDLALGFFGRQGLDADHAAIKAAIDGDFSLLEAYLGEKGAQGWQQYVALAKEAHANAMDTVKQGEAKITEAVAKTLEQFGYDNKQWGEAIDWVRKESPEEVDEINKLMSSGPLGARAITAFILSNHRQASGVEFTPQKGAVKEEQGANGGAERQPVTPISKAQFSQEAEKLARSFGPDYMSTPEYQLLRQRAGVGRRN